MRAISPMATWYEQPASLLHRRITIVKFDDDYTSVFAKYAE